MTSLCFLGTSFAAQHLSKAARDKGFALVPAADAELVFVSEDTPTDGIGKRDLAPIERLLRFALEHTTVPVVLTSQVPPGFTRSFNELRRLYHMAETLRVRDAAERAANPEQFIIGMSDRRRTVLPMPLLSYFAAFGCPIILGSYEDAEFTKIAINMCLAAQVDTANRLSALAAKVDARWEFVAQVLRNDRRIGPHAYLTPGCWQDSKHLLRDDYTVRGIEAKAMPLIGGDSTGLWVADK